ncbi:MAG TPA: sigma-70 family RNA polymerase sigma factor [Rhodothermales bacterium]|nr:sigma-70 family RNA polymerase sigma factor [Rhodothermales bacterium]
MAASRDNITLLLKQASEGHAEAQQNLYPVVYDELLRIAHGRLVRYRPGETLNTTALVHEAYLKLVDQSQAEWNDRAHFLATASRAMRFILIDYARRRTAQKRGGQAHEVPLSAVQIAADERSADLISLNDALDKLAAYSERLAQLVEYRYFGGLTYEEIAEVTGWSVPTVRRDWKRARVWLYRAIQPDRDTPA